MITNLSLAMITRSTLAVITIWQSTNRDHGWGGGRGATEGPTRYRPDVGRSAVRAVSIALGCALAWAVLLIALHPGDSGQLIALPAVALTLLAATLCAAVLSRLSVPLGAAGGPSVLQPGSAPAPARVHDPDRPGTVRPRAPGDRRI